MSEWREFPVCEIAEVIMGQSPNSSTCNEDESGLPFLQGCADFGNKYPVKKFYCTEPKKIAPVNSTLLSVRAPVGSMNRAITDCCIGRGLCSIVARKANQDFLEYKLHLAIPALERLSQGSTFQAINTADINNLHLFVPDSLDEQRKIARILSTVDEVIERTEAAIAKYKAIKQGMMHDLFTRGIDLKTGKLRPKYEDAPELYKQTELGWVPKDWVSFILEELTTRIGDGIHATPKYIESSDYFFINGNNLSGGRISINSAACVSLNEFKKHFIQLDESSLLMSINGTIGNLAIYSGEKVILGKSAAYISCSRKLDKYFAYYLLQTKNTVKYFDVQLTGSTIKNLSLAVIRRMPVYRPDIAEQRRISICLGSLDLSINSYHAELSKCILLKKGLMSCLLTGIVMVKIDQKESAR